MSFSLSPAQDVKFAASIPKYSFDSSMPLNKTARPFGVTSTESSHSGTPIKSVSYKPVSLYTPPSALPSTAPATQAQLKYGSPTEKRNSTASTLQHLNGYVKTCFQASMKCSPNKWQPPTCCIKEEDLLLSLRSLSELFKTI